MVAEVLKQLRKLKINDENVKDVSVLKLIESNPQLTQLQLNKMYKLKPTLFQAALESLIKIKKLNLNLCYQMTDLVSILTKNSTCLTSLKLENIQLKKESLEQILNLDQLKVLNLACNRNVTETYVIQIASHLTKLTKLNLNNCPVTNRALEALALGPLGSRIIKLELAGTEITHLGMKFFLEFGSILELNLSSNNISDMVKHISILLSRLLQLRTVGLHGYEQLVIQTANSYHVNVK